MNPLVHSVCFVLIAIQGKRTPARHSLHSRETRMPYYRQGKSYYCRKLADNENYLFSHSFNCDLNG